MRCPIRGVHTCGVFLPCRRDEDGGAIDAVFLHETLDRQLRLATVLKRPFSVVVMVCLLSMS